MNLKKVAVLLTVFNRRETTLACLRTFQKCSSLMKHFGFDVFLTDDGCTDGTVDAVNREFPRVFVIKGTGSLYWSGGMRLAWETALKHDSYDYFIWLNDDAILFDNALNCLFEPLEILSEDVVVSGAFKDDQGNCSYGGKNEMGCLIEPKKDIFQNITFMNGNLVLIPSTVVSKIGIIDEYYKHSFGDWDYGIRALKNNIKVCLTSEYVGFTNRHDVNIPKYADPNIPMLKRLKILYSPFYNPKYIFHFWFKKGDVLSAIKYYFTQHFHSLFCPWISN